MVLLGGVLEREPYETTGFSPANTSGWQQTCAGKGKEKEYRSDLMEGNKNFYR